MSTSTRARIPDIVAKYEGEILSEWMASQLTGITVTGSRSGAHAGVVKGDSDGRGGSFLPRGLMRPSVRLPILFYPAVPP